MNSFKFLISSITIILSSNIFACNSVDTVLKEYNVGISSQIEVAKVIECNLNKTLSRKSLCKTRIGIKTDLFSYAKNAYEYGFITTEELYKAKEELDQVKDICK